MNSLTARDQRVCWHPYTQHQLDTESLPVVAAKNATLTLADGTQLLDAISSWWANLHGHGRRELVQALTQQAQQLDHVMFAGFTHEPAVGLAEVLLKLAPQGLARVFYSDNGSTAVEVALKAAYQTWLRRGEKNRTVFLALNGAYHGDTFGAMSVGEPHPFFVEFEPLLFKGVRVAPEIEALEEALQKNAGRVAAFILEPLVQGAAGMQMHSPEFLRQVRATCDRHHTLLIADEVMTGFGRTGHRFACNAGPITPDILCLAKGLTGGIFPLAATLVKEEIYAAFLSAARSKAFFHGHTFTANPMGCAVALASMELVQREDTPARLDGIGRRLESSLRELAEEAFVEEIRRCGGIVAVQFKASDSGYLAGMGDALRQACRESKTVLLRPLGNVLYAMPPSCCTAEEVEAIGRAMHAVAQSAIRTLKHHGFV